MNGLIPQDRGKTALARQPEEMSSATSEGFKSRDITFPTKVHLVKAMDFPLVIYGCETWTIKKAEC